MHGFIVHCTWCAWIGGDMVRRNKMKKIQVYVGIKVPCSTVHGSNVICSSFIGFFPFSLPQYEWRHFYNHFNIPLHEQISIKIFYFWKVLKLSSKSKSEIQYFMGWMLENFSLQHFRMPWFLWLFHWGL